MKLFFVREHPRDWIVHAIWNDLLRLIWIGPLRIIVRFPSLDDLERHSIPVVSVEDLIP